MRGRPRKTIVNATGNTDNILSTIVQAKHGHWVDDGVHFYDYLINQPKPGHINIPYIRDIPAVQAQMAHYSKDHVLELSRKHRKALSNVDGFITMTDMFAEKIKEFYGLDVPYRKFRNYPSWRENRHSKVREIVYIDNSGSLPLGFKEHLFFLHKITINSKIPTVFVSKKFHDFAKGMVRDYHLKVRTLPMRKYKYNSKFGILMDTRGFGQCEEAMPRKLLIYLMCEMGVLVDSPWKESINYMNSVNLNPLVYENSSVLASKLSKFKFGSWRGRYFSMENRIPDLKEALISLKEEIK